MTRSVVIVGGGPRGTGVLERLAASAPEFVEDLDVHLVDPYPDGAGRIWREDQSALLWMNSMAADVTMFTDDSVRCEGPIVPGPSLYDWAVAVRDGELEGESVPDGPVGDELRALGPATFATRRLQSHYLDFVLRRVLATLPPQVRVHRHRTRAVGLRRGAPDVVLLDGASDEIPAELPADVLVLASGHLDAAPTEAEAALAAHADEHGLRYFPPEQTTDSDLDRIPAGETVIARGMGLAFIDLMVLLFEGRGGRFHDRGDGTLDYEPSGREPVVQVGSGRGVPYHAKTEYALRGPRPPLPRFLGPDEIAGFVRRGSVDLRRDVWPLMAKEVGWAYYHELFAGHPDRVRGVWDDFALRFAALDWYTPAMHELVAGFVPDPSDRLDFERMDRPLDDVSAPDLASLQERLRSYVLDDLARHVDDRYTAELGAFVGLLSVFAQVAELAGTPALTPRSRAQDLAWWQNFFSSLASGPPGPRLRQLLALSRAGYVVFLGAGLQVDPVDGGFRATSASLDRVAVTARTFVEARLSSPSVSRSDDPMLAGLHAEGLLDEETLREEHTDSAPAVHAADAAVAHSGAAVTLHNTGLVRVRASDFRLVDAEGRPDPCRFAIGPHTNVRLPGAFTRPNTNALSFRANDALARAVLTQLAESAPAEGRLSA
ncbi:FAD/NAD(P)-binding protein [Actinomycetospora chibensis]|uniref:FAD/NAD(P)-binding protein n=1 Tax=Actinomycetospora chibensis TaxID=663606 RepID=A0ABV9RFI4_9PSEU|nr:FAD/NAD(P)-binding protein [Actinomycetospora chibensis]MDD7922950.1 FAD/NAD(P)-binding protein [Actinomycetospora chibensis]